MGMFLRKARRRALARHWQRDARHDAALSANLAAPEDPFCEIDPTPTPRPVAIDLAPPSAPVLGRFAAHRLSPVRRRLAVAVAAMAAFVVGVLALSGAPRAAADAPARLAAPALPTPSPPRPAVAPLPPVASPAPAGPRADAHLDRSRHSPIPGGVLFAPSTFSSADGTYDLYLHFHGNTRVVLESTEHAGLNAMVAIVNLGVNSAPYLDAFEEPGSFERLLASIDHGVAERGLAGPKLRRIAIGSWSGGYGAVSRIFEVAQAGLAKIDAVLVLDGIHCGYREEAPGELNVRVISPFLAPARRAAMGELLFSITHSEIDPPTYAGSHVTAGYLLDVVRGVRGAPQPPPEHVQLKAAEGAVAKRLEKRMEPTSDTTVGAFHVRGYRGSTPEHHMAHLLQMAATVMPELVSRWQKP
jgi:hypothetical protein